MNAFLLLLWISAVYKSSEAISHRGEQKRNVLHEREPHPYTISFFTFPNGLQFPNSKTTTKRDNEDPSDQDDSSPVKRSDTKTKTKNAGITSKNATKNEKSSSAMATSVAEAPSTENHQAKDRAHGEHAKKTHAKHKISSKPFVQLSEKPSSLDLAGKPPEVGPQKGHEKVDASKIGSSHNKIQIKKHQNQQATDEAYQEGSVNHPSHKMYPECHHCASNSSYEDCAKSSTLAKCDQGLNNICFTKSFRSTTRGMIYEMGCSNHIQCRHAKAKPCKGKAKKCFVCCQYDGCNAVPHHDSYTSEKDEADFAYLNKALKYSSPNWVMLAIVFLHALILLW